MLAAELNMICQTLPNGSSLDISLEAEGGFLNSPRGAPQLLSDNAVPEILF